MIRQPATFTIVFLAGLGAALSSSCSIFPSRTSMVSIHPEALPPGRPACVECHEGQQVKTTGKSFEAYAHTDLFIKDHRFAAGRDERVCAVCHSRSFCTDCHDTKTESKPSVLRGNRPDRELPHRGDYLTRHRIEGKIDPASCYSCHGRGNNEKCMTCHR